MISFRDAKRDGKLRQKWLNNWLKENPSEAVQSILYLPGITKRKIPYPNNRKESIESILEAKEHYKTANFGKRAWVGVHIDNFAKEIPHPIYVTPLLFEGGYAGSHNDFQLALESTLCHEVRHAEDAMYGMQIGRTVNINRHNVEDLSIGVFVHVGEVRANLWVAKGFKKLRRRSLARYSAIEARMNMHSMQFYARKGTELDKLVSSTQSRIFRQTRDRYNLIPNP